MFEDQTVELLPERTVMGRVAIGGRGGNGGRGGDGGYAVAIQAFNIAGRDNVNVADASGGDANGGAGGNADASGNF